ncbi:hypothetical protein pdam_00020953 [Pocillopora damicornis]|uniref:Sodium channel protein n=1 Tax=Pocillopora damicornis TaxID=46731 RepID=A0A3M6TVD5_POCDA|nr:hypothetical protein pdam_00020953 [Pocillopora damicornis]
MPLVGAPQSNKMTRDEEDEQKSALDVANPDEILKVSPRRRKKVVTFASLGDLAQVQALATNEADPQTSELEKGDGSEESMPSAPIDPGHFLNMPLEDYDATGKNVPADDTFLVLRQYGTTSIGHHMFRFNRARSLWLFGPLHPLRRYVFTAIYTLEMLLKIISRGLILHTYAYLRDPWNWLDFIVVVLGYITMAPNIANFTAIRTVRVLRALRTISVVSGLRAMVNTLLRSLKLLSDVLVLFLFFLAVMALIGLQLFVGELRNKCVLDPPENFTEDIGGYIQNESTWLMRNGEPVVCGNSSWAGSCPVNYTCMADAGPNPDYGFTGFDHIGWALLMAFQILTMDYWENLYNKVVRAVGIWYVFYFVITIFFCSFYLLNLVLAVVYLSYEKELQSLQHEERRKELLKKTASSYIADPDSVKFLKPLKKLGKTTKAIAELTQAACIVTEVPEVHRGDARKRLSLAKTLMKFFQHVKTNCDNLFSKFPFFKPMRKRMRAAAECATFDVVIIGIILLNTIVLALYHYGIEKSFENVLDLCNMVFTIIFVVEMIWKLIAFGPLTYVKSRWNIFDAIIVIASVAGYLTESGGSFSIFRSLRLFRVLNLAQSWKTMNKLVSAITKSVGPVGNITLILGVIIYIFAVVGMRVFGDAYTEDKFGNYGIPRWNFNDFWHAFMMVFRVLCGEWIEPLWDCMRATSPLALLVFLPAFVIGNFIVLNLFIALLLSAFDSEEEESTSDDDEEQNSRLRRILKRLTKTKKTRLFVATFKERYKLYEVQLLESNVTTRRSQTSGAQVITCEDQSSKRIPKKYIVEVDDCLPECCMFSMSSRLHFRWLKFRCSIRCLVEHKYFEWFILFTVMFSSFVLIFEDIHLPERPLLAKALDILNYFFAAVFSMEFLLKIFGLGVVKYFSSVWNCLDAFIVAISLACLSENKQLSVFRSLRTLRALRPLRAISRMEGMKVVINALFAAIPGIGNVLVVSLLFWLIFSILGVQLFSGKFQECVDQVGERVSADVVPNKTECLRFPEKYTWRNAEANFDNVFNGFLALFLVATFEGWIEVMHSAVDSTEVDKQPQMNSNMIAYIYFVAFIILGSFFVLNLFVGVVIDNFNSLKKKHGNVPDRDSKKMGQLPERSSKEKASSERIKTKGSISCLPLRRSHRRQVRDRDSDGDNMQYGDDDDTTSWTVPRISNLVFTGIFTAEAMVKLIALRQHYFRKAWNVFDFVIVISSLIGVVLDEVSVRDTVVNPSLLRVMRIFRIARLLRVLEFAKGIRQLLVALMISLPALFNIGTLLFLVIFIYAIIGMSAFGRVKKEGTLDDIVNFETFGSSLMLLFRLSTGSGWNDVMNSLSIQPPDCDPYYEGYPNGDCGTPLGAAAYLISYIVVVFMIIVNMYIAVILENVNRAHENDDFAITKEDFERYYLKWAAFVPNGKQFIPLSQLSDFVNELDKPFRHPKPNESRLREFNIPIRAGELIHCFDLLKALVRCTLEEHGESPEVFQEITVRMEAQFTKSLGRKHSIAILGSTQTKFECEDKTDMV